MVRDDWKRTKWIQRSFFFSYYLFNFEPNSEFHINKVRFVCSHKNRISYEHNWNVKRLYIRSWCRWCRRWCCCCAKKKVCSFRLAKNNEFWIWEFFQNIILFFILICIPFFFACVRRSRPIDSFVVRKQREHIDVICVSELLRVAIKFIWIDLVQCDGATQCGIQKNK